MGGFFIGPRTPNSLQKKYCVTNHKFAGPFGVSLNCDSWGFLEYAQKPRELLQKDNLRQSRPLEILLASLISQPLHLINSLDEKSPTAFEKAEYIAYVSLNMLILLAGFWIYYILVNSKRQQTTGGTPLSASTNLTTKYQSLRIGTIAIATLLISNDIVKIYGWSADTEMFNILAPLLCLWALFVIIRNNSFGHISSYIFTLLAGLGITAYGSFLIFVPTMAVPGILILFRERFRPKAIKRVGLHGIALGLVFLTPTLLWYVIVKLTVGSYYIDTIHRKHIFMWIDSAIQHGWLQSVSILYHHTLICLKFLLHQGTILILVMFLLIGARLIWIPKKQIVTDQRLKQLISAAIVISSLYFLFNIFIGFNWKRIEFSILIPWIVVLGAYSQKLSELLKKNQARIFNFILVAGMIAFSIFEIAKSGPYEF